ncbi:hypothetical protein Dimus_030634 [Dionaea muscipula]
MRQWRLSASGSLSEHVSSLHEDAASSSMWRAATCRAAEGYEQRYAIPPAREQLHVASSGIPLGVQRSPLLASTFITYGQLPSSMRYIEWPAPLIHTGSSGHPKSSQTHGINYNEYNSQVDRRTDREPVEFPVDRNLTTGRPVVLRLQKL